jgi:hypothetical protein
LELLFVSGLRWQVVEETTQADGKQVGEDSNSADSGEKKVASPEGSPEDQLRRNRGVPSIDRSLGDFLSRPQVLKGLENAQQPVDEDPEWLKCCGKGSRQETEDDLLELEAA